MREITTTDFSRFGWRERKLASELLDASIKQGFPSDFNDDEVQIMMNFNSGNVFFTNSDCQVAMMNGDKLESFYTTPYSGIEGFADDLLEEFKNGNIFRKEDIEYLLELGIIEEMDDEDYYDKELAKLEDEE